MTSQEDTNELEQLLADLAENRLTDEQFARLDALLLHNPSLQEEYKRYVELHAILQYELRPQASTSPAETPEATGVCQSVDEGSAGDLSVRSAIATNLARGLRNWRTLATLAATIVIAIATAESWMHYRSGKNSLPSPQAVHGRANVNHGTHSISPAAFLTSANGCNWSGTPAIYTVGSGVQVGDEIALTEGVAEFRLGSGVSLAVEGPACLLLASPSKLVLQYGKLTAHAPWGTEEFRVVLAGCCVTARDAEFGVSLTGNKLDIHVFSGEVAAASSIASAEFDEEALVAEDSYFSDAIINSGRALRLMAQGEVLRVVKWDKATSNQFVSKLSMSGALGTPQQYVELVKSARPISYWRFEKVVDSKIPNEINPNLPLFVRENVELVGSKDNLAAEFRWNDYWHLRTKSTLPMKGPDYSIEAWVKPSHRHRGSLIFLDDKDKNSRSTARMELQGGTGEHRGAFPGVVRYSHRANSSTPQLGKSCFSSGPYAIRRWQHVVAVKNNSQMKLYVDGKLAGSAEETTLLNGDMYVMIGSIGPGPDERKFIGQLDEVAIYDRALSDKEILKHYKALKTTTESSSAEKHPKRSSGSKEV